MKNMKRLVFTLICSALVTLSVDAQIKIKKPTVKVPKVSTPSVKTGGSKSTSVVPTKDPSGLFKNCTDDPSAASHRRNAVSNLETLEAEYKKESVDYELVKKTLTSNEKTMGFILKLEPKVKAEDYNARYTPLKERATKEVAIYDKVKALEKLFSDEFSAPTEYQKFNPITYLTDGYGAKDECYCRTYDRNKTLEDYNTSKKEYTDLTSKLVGYKHDRTQTLFSNMNTCIDNGNKWAVWASKENVQSQVVDFSAKEKPLDPNRVIKRCDEYLAGLKRVETDNSLAFTETTKTAIEEGKKVVMDTKSEAERYVSSGDFDAYKAKLHQEKIDKEFMPKAVSSNSSLQQGAMKYIKGTEMNTYVTERLDRKPVASTIKAHVVTTKPYIKKNEYDLPKYKYHEIWVAFKDTDGKCYKALVYATYQYTGGGTYESVPTYSADKPIEMNCANVNK
jgi:hypothetical protein